MTNNVGIKLRDYQIPIEQEVFDELDGGVNPVLALDTGLGKTIVSISIIFRFLEKYPHSNILVLVRKTNLYDPWIESFEKYNLAYQKYHGKRNFLVIKDSNGDNCIGFLKNRVVISTYNIYMKEQKLFKNIDFVIMDEIHTFNNTKKMGRVFYSLFNLAAKYKLALTATPVQNMKNEIISLYYMLNNPVDFDESLLKPPKDKNDRESLNRMVNFCLSTGFLMVRSKDKLNLKELPEKKEIAFFIPMNQIHKKDFKKNTDKKYNKGWINKVMYLTESEMKILQENKQIEMPVVSDFLRILFSKIPQNDKIIVFSSYINNLNYYCNMFQNDYICFVISGKNNNKDIEHKLRYFKSSHGKVIMFASFKKMAEGVNLQNANHVIFVDLWWNPQKHFQAADRIHRLGQKKPCFVYYFIYKDKIREVDDCLSVIENKIEETNETLGTIRDFPEQIEFNGTQNILRDFEVKLDELYKDYHYEQPNELSVKKDTVKGLTIPPDYDVDAQVKKHYEDIIQGIKKLESEIKVYTDLNDKKNQLQSQYLLEIELNLKKQLEMTHRFPKPTFADESTPSMPPESPSNLPT